MYVGMYVRMYWLTDTYWVEWGVGVDQPMYLKILSEISGFPREVEGNCTLPAY